MSLYPAFQLQLSPPLHTVTYSHNENTHAESTSEILSLNQFPKSLFFLPKSNLPQL